MVKPGCLLINLNNDIVPGTFGRRTCGLIAADIDTGSICQVLQGYPELEIIVLFEKSKNVAALVAAEAIKKLLLLRN